MVYKLGEQVQGVVSGVKPYGAFVRIADDYNGLIHISEISGKFISDVRSYLSIGEEVTARIIDIDNERKQLRLSLKTLPDDRYKPHRYRRYLPENRKKATELLAQLPKMLENLGEWYD